MANYEALKANVDKNGEVMIQVDTGEELKYLSTKSGLKIVQRK